MSEQLTHVVIDGSSISLHSLMRNVISGSNRQDSAGEFQILLSKAFSETCVKAIFLEDLKEDEHLFQCQREQKYL